MRIDPNLSFIALFAVVYCYTYQVSSLKSSNAPHAYHSYYISGTLWVLSHYTILPMVRLLNFAAVQCCFHHLSDFGRTNHWKKTVFRHPHGWPDQNSPSFNVSSVTGGLMSHAFTIKIICLYDESEIKDWYPRVELIFSVRKPPLVGYPHCLGPFAGMRLYHYRLFSNLTYCCCSCQLKKIIPLARK